VGELQQETDVTLSDGTRVNASDYVETTQSTQRIVIAGYNHQPALLAIDSATDHFICPNRYAVILGFKFISDFESKAVIQPLRRNICLGYK